MQKDKIKKEIKLISQCPVCNSVKVLWPKGEVKYQQSIGVFNNLTKEKCLACLRKQPKM